MLTLSLLLGAAAGVNALAGGGVTGVNVTEGVHVCADGCSYNGVFFSENGYYCPMEELVHLVDADGTDAFYFPYHCAGEDLSDGQTERRLRDGEKPLECDTEISEKRCIAYPYRLKRKSKVIEWSEVVEELKKAKAQNAQSSPEKPSPALEKPVNCADEGLKAFRKCQEEKVESFSECNQRGTEAIEACNQK
ncbi:hypothetical protein ACQRIU_005398 [Beauveria bassiana]